MSRPTPDASSNRYQPLGGPQELAALYRFTDRLFRAKSVHDIHEAALDAIVAAMGCERASILQFDQEHVMRFVAWRGLSERYRHAVDGHSPWVAGERDAAPLTISDIEKSDQPAAIKATIGAENIRALAFIPLMIGGEVVGKFMFYYDRPHEFTAQEIDIAVTISRQLGFSWRRLRTEAALRQERERFQAIIDRIPVMIKIYDPDRNVLRLNPEFERVLGWSTEDAIGVDLMSELFPDPDLRARAQKFMEACPEGWLDFPMRTRTGGRIETSWANVRLSDGSRVGIGLDITERHQASERQELLLREMDHRIRNLFTLAGSMVTLSGREAVDVADLVKVVRERLDALARAHALTVSDQAGGGARSQATTLHALIDAILSPYERPADAGRRIAVVGADTVLSGEAVTAFALLLHEFATNAAKYGALSTERGRIEIETCRADGRLDMTWREEGGPPVPVEHLDGFGSRLAKVTAGQLGGEFAREWRPEGLVIRLSAAVQRLQRDGGQIQRAAS